VFASMSAIAEFQPEDISMFLRKHKRVRVSLEEHVSSDVVRGVTDARVDLGVCWMRSISAACKPFPTAAITSRSSPPRAPAREAQVSLVRGYDRFQACGPTVDADRHGVGWAVRALSCILS
jgi:DNA-binding transcriptional LysR family regulator